jgi:hypothetical protein
MSSYSAGLILNRIQEVKKQIVRWTNETKTDKNRLENSLKYLKEHQEELRLLNHDYVTLGGSTKDLT